jgi:hypothetical protein
MARDGCEGQGADRHGGGAFVTTWGTCMPSGPFACAPHSGELRSEIVQVAQPGDRPAAVPGAVFAVDQVQLLARTAIVRGEGVEIRFGERVGFALK